MSRRSMVAAAFAFAVAAALALPGCAQGPGPLRRHPGVESTLGTDPETVPPGTVYGPSGLGVDLVHRDANGQTVPSPSIARPAAGPLVAPARS